MFSININAQREVADPADTNVAALVNALAEAGYKLAGYNVFDAGSLCSSPAPVPASTSATAPDTAASTTTETATATDKKDRKARSTAAKTDAAPATETKEPPKTEEPPTDTRTEEELRLALRGVLVPWALEKGKTGKDGKAGKGCLQAVNKFVHDSFKVELLGLVPVAELPNAIKLAEAFDFAASQEKILAAEAAAAEAASADPAI